MLFYLFVYRLDRRNVIIFSSVFSYCRQKKCIVGDDLFLSIMNVFISITKRGKGVYLFLVQHLSAVI